VCLMVPVCDPSNSPFQFWMIDSSHGNTLWNIPICSGKSQVCGIYSTFSIGSDIKIDSRTGLNTEYDRITHAGVPFTRSKSFRRNNHTRCIIVCNSYRNSVSYIVISGIVNTYCTVGNLT